MLRETNAIRDVISHAREEMCGILMGTLGIHGKLAWLQTYRRSILMHRMRNGWFCFGTICEFLILTTDFQSVFIPFKKI